MNFETFAARFNASMSDLGDFGLHSPTGDMSARARARNAAALTKANAAWQERRNAARVAYDGLGLQETLEAVASGHPDNLSTQSALRVLEKRKARMISQNNI